MLNINVPQRSITTIPSRTAESIYLAILTFFPLVREISGAAAKKPKMNPPVGPASLAIPAVPPENTGSPTHPSRVKTRTEKKEDTGERISPIRVTISVLAVITMGVKGMGKDR